MAKSARRIARRSGHQSDQTEAGGVPPGLTAAESSPIDTKKLKIFMPGPIDKDFVPYMWRPMMRLLSYQYPVVRASIFPYMPDRHTNAWIENGRSPLQVGICYRLGLNIGQLRELTPAAAVARSQDQESLSLLVVLGGSGFSVEPRQHLLVLPRRGSTAPIFFAITPLRAGTLILCISFYLARELALLQEFEVPIEAATKKNAKQQYIQATAGVDQT